MTSLVGVFCKDGVVIGSDSSATFSTGRYPTIEQPFEKIHIVGERVIVAGTGQIGLGQRFISNVQKAYEQKVFDSNSTIDISRILARDAVNDFYETKVEHNNYGALVAYPTGNKANLCEFSVVDFQPEIKNEKCWFVSMGSGQPITDPFLAFIHEVFWNDGVPTVNDAVFAVKWTLDHVIKYNPGGINGPVRIAVLESISGKQKARLLSDDDLLEHNENIEECKAALKSLRDKHKNINDSVPTIPTA